MSEQNNKDIDLLKLRMEEKRIETDGKFKEAELKLKEQEQRISRLQVWIPVLTILLSAASSYLVSSVTSSTTIQAEQIKAATQIQLDLNKNLNEQNKELSKKREAQRKPDAEIKNRFQEVSRALQETETRMKKRDRDDPKYIYVRIFKLLDGKDYKRADQPIDSLYPENQDKSFKQLVNDLTGLVDEEEEKSDLNKSLSAYDRLEELTKTASEQMQEEEQALADIRKLINTELLIPRWR